MKKPAEIGVLCWLFYLSESRIKRILGLTGFFSFGRAPATQGRHIPGFASLGATHASPLHAPHARVVRIIKEQETTK